MDKKLTLVLFLINVSFFNVLGDKNCFPRWLTGSKSRIHVSFRPINNQSSRKKHDIQLDFQSISIRFPKDITEILSCDFDPRTKIQIRYNFEFLAVKLHCRPIKFDTIRKSIEWFIFFPSIYFRYREKESSSREKIYHLLPNNIRQNVVISNLKPCTLYSLRVRVTFPQSDTKLILSLEDFYTGPNNMISSLDVKNITDSSATIAWNPSEIGMECATSFVIKDQIASFEVEPHKVLTTWRKLEPCMEYKIEVYPRFHGKTGMSTTKTYSTFPNAKSFDVWMDSSENKIFWRFNANEEICEESIVKIQYDFILESCQIYDDKKQLHTIPLEKTCSSLRGCFIDIDKLRTQISKITNFQEGLMYNVHLRGRFEKNDKQTMFFNVLSNLNFKSNHDDHFSFTEQFDNKCNENLKDTTTSPVMDKSETDELTSYQLNNSESHNSTIIGIAFVGSIFVTISIFSFYVYHKQVKKHVKRLSTRVNRLSQNMAPHYAQYFQGPINERISIVNS